jgi:hypothetical protein
MATHYLVVITVAIIIIIRVVLAYTFLQTLIKIIIIDGCLLMLIRYMRMYWLRIRIGLWRELAIICRYSY